MATVARQPQTCPESSASAAGLRLPLPGTTAGRGGAGHGGSAPAPIGRPRAAGADETGESAGEEKNSLSAGKMGDLGHPSTNHLPMTTRCELPACPAANRRVLAIRLSGPGRDSMRMIRIERCPDDAD